MSIGLELGSNLFRSLRSVGDEVVGRSCHAVYVTLADTAAHRRLLEQAGAQFIPCGDDLVLLGNTALEWADMLNLPIVSLLPEGRVPQSDAVARQILTLMIDAVLPAANHPGEICCLTIPGRQNLNRTLPSYDVRFFQQLVTLRGYQPRLISSGMAVTLAELADASFSGVGVRFDSTDCHFSVAHCGRELAACSVDGLEFTHSMDAVDAINAGITSSSRRPATQHTNTQHTNLVLLERSLHAVFTSARDELMRGGAVQLLGRPVQIACAGGPTDVANFSDILTRAWKDADWPMETGRIRIRPSSDYSVARGCLIQARLENHDADFRAA